MRDVIKKIGLLISTFILAVGFLFLFFGGTLEGVRFALELFGVIYILQLCYSIFKKEEQEKQNKKDLKEKIKKYGF